jgi:predicted DNA-binding transcriptional regulator YafY
MTRSERLLALLQSIRARRAPVTAAALAAEFGLSQRSIYRDIALLVGQGALIDGAAGLGYVIRPGYFLPPLMFAPDEADAVALGLRYVLRRGDAALARAARNAFAKLIEVIPETAGYQIQSNGLLVGPVVSQHEHALAAIRSSIRRGLKLCITYRNGEGRLSARTVWPVALGFFEEVEMLAAWCELRSAFRHFRLNRIVGLEVSEDRIPSGHRRLLSDYRKIEAGIEL